MPDPLDRLTVAKAKIDELFGPNYAQQHPEVVVVVAQSAAADWAAHRIGQAIERVAEALVEPEAPQHIVPAQLLRGPPVTGILIVLSILTPVLFAALMVVALVEAVEAHGRRR